jgi:hypothetical protein
MTLACISHQLRLPCILGSKQLAMVGYAHCFSDNLRRGEIDWPLVNIVRVLFVNIFEYNTSELLVIK